MRSTVGQLKEFKNSFIYKDMMEELGVWLDMVRDQMEMQSNSFEQLRVLQGNAETIRNCQHMVDQFIENLEADVDESDKDQLEREMKKDE